MLRVTPRSPFAALARAWSGPQPPGAEVALATQGALAAMRPDDLAEVGPLAEALLGGLSHPARRQASRRALLAFLDRVRRRAFTAILEPEDVEAWTRLVLRAVREADYAFGDLLSSREETDPRTIALRVMGADPCELTVADVARRTRAIARGLLPLLEGDGQARVAILSENGLDAALCDLACLANGIVDTPLPANAVAEQVVTMLRHSRARVLLAADDEQVAKVLPSLSALPDLRHVVAFSRATAERNGLASLEQVVGRAGEADDAARAARAAAVKATDVASVMYTSGTTGRPKGILFTHENVVSKRFCRAFALPNVNEGDVFLCYLPLYHTFGRFLDLCGSLFWGATYVFARSAAQATLLEDLKRVRPTVLISVPKKWMELHEAAAAEAGSDDPRDLAAPLRALTGGRLRYGLSAAGYLDPAVFQAFHGAGVALCSGYGMTEATGGVTMTAPGDYVEGSIGKPLPGVECRVAAGGELQVRGAYVSPGYLGPGEEEQGRDAEGWFATGDLVSVDPSGHLRLVGRKKEIYKSQQGQTIAPQRVENLYRDFEAVSQAFLVGDHREYNTLLVWPNPASPAVAGKAPEEVRELLSSLVASANRFLAPFERVAAFEVLPRAIDEAHGELTHKLTFKRDVVERSFGALIERMYEQRHVALAVDGFSLRVPSWVLREIGVLPHEVTLEGGALRARHRVLPVGAVAAAPGSLRIGDLAYASDGAQADLGTLLSRPALWLGNEALRTFLGDEAFVSLVSRPRKAARELRLDPRFWPAPPPVRVRRLLDIVDRDEPSFHSIHAAGELLRAERPEASRAVAHLRAALAVDRREHASLARALLRRAADAPDEDVRRRAFRALLPDDAASETVKTLRRFLDRMGESALREDDLAELASRGLSEAQVQVLLRDLARRAERDAPVDPSDRRLLLGEVRLLTATAIARPAWFAQVRVPLARLALNDDPEIAARAREELDRLRRGFWNWIGPNLRRAVDPATGAAYAWKDVLTFDRQVGPSEAQHLLLAVEESTLVRGSVFLLGGGALLSLADIPPRGASVSLLGHQHGKNVYRLSIHTRARESYDVAINVAEEMNFREFKEEVAWLLAAGARPPLVEQFGGCFPEWGIFTEEFIPGETVEKQVARLVRQGESRRLKLLWPFLAWTALDAHVRFWDRTGRRLALREPSPSAFIVPSHDYQTGGRLVSISDRTPCDSLDELLDRFQRSFVERVEASVPELRGEVNDALVLGAVVEALGMERGLALLSRAAQESRHAVALETFLERVRDEGLLPRRAWFAIRRYRRWLEVNPAATVEARGKMLGELWGTYSLGEVEETAPETRLRFFRETVFASARPELAAALDALIARARALPAGDLELEEPVAALRGAISPTPEEDWFLARMTYRYLAPGDEVALISVPSGGHFVTEVVAAIGDADGNRFVARGPVSPREVARLLAVFHDANLNVTFAAEHEFLVCLDAREVVVGGLYWARSAPDTVHLEKMVVARRHRGAGLAESLLREFFRRLASRGVRRVETGWFHPEYLRRFGFRTDPSSGGLVRDLEQEGDGAGASPAASEASDVSSP
ncbi:MAG TPA: GNAT family N-acetyltransferase [Anaeromyxobacter sp.]